MSLLRRTVATSAPAAVVIIRLAVGPVFLSEGIQKFLYPAEVGAGRFATIGMPRPEIVAPLVGVIEIVCGALILLGLFTRPAAVALVADMAAALVSTKVPVLLGRGFWGMTHEARTDWAMLLGAVFLLAVGAGAWSLDARLMSKLRPLPSYRRRRP